jgi:hypothetical protein
MDREVLEEMVEEIMRYYYMGDYEKYSSEELREKYRQELLEKENKDARC